MVVEPENAGLVTVFLELFFPQGFHTYLFQANFKCPVSSLTSRGFFGVGFIV